MGFVLTELLAVDDSMVGRVGLRIDGTSFTANSVVTFFVRKQLVILYI